MALKPCLDCGGLQNTGAPRCQGCRSRREQERDAVRGNRHQRGLGSDHDRIRAQVLAGDPLCYWCKARPATTADHLIRRVDGGRNTLDNYVPACAPCNYGRRTPKG